MRKSILLGLFLAVVFCGFSLPAAQATPISAVTFSNTSSPNYVNSDLTMGWTFTVSGNILVTNLGVFDSGQDGLAVSHQVGIYDGKGNLVAVATVPAGSSTLVNQFQYVSISPTQLTAGDYAIGATYYQSGTQDNYLANASNFQTGPKITFGEDVYNVGSGSGLVDPAGGYHIASFTSGIFGPNFEYTTVPEPTTLLLLGLGLVVVLGLRQKLKN